MLLYIDAWESFDVISVMRQVRASLAAGTVTLDKFVITPISEPSAVKTWSSGEFLCTILTACPVRS